MSRREQLLSVFWLLTADRVSFVIAAHNRSPLPITSTPALAAAIRSMAAERFALPAYPQNRRNALVPMYQVAEGDVTAEATALAHVISNIADRLRRLGDAYGEWQQFDAPAYFDLSVEQTDRLVKVSERVSTVHVGFAADLLVPAFQQTVTFWQETFAPAYQQMRHDPLLGTKVYPAAHAQMVAYWQQLLAVLQAARTILAEDIGYLATNAAQEERTRWRIWWATPTVGGLAAPLTPALAEVPTLTLSFEFPLPSHRQPERLRRLRANRERRRTRRINLTRPR